MESVTVRWVDLGTRVVVRHNVRLAQDIGAVDHGQQECRDGQLHASGKEAERGLSSESQKHGLAPLEGGVKTMEIDLSQVRWARRKRDMQSDAEEKEMTSEGTCRVVGRTTCVGDVMARLVSHTCRAWNSSL